MSPTLSNQEQVAVIIAGAGPTGLTLACELARRGISSRLIEAAPDPQPGSRGKGVQPRTLEVFDNLGILDRILANGRMGMPIRSTGADGKVTMSGAQPPEPRPDVPYPTSVITPQWRVEEALRSLLADLGGSVEFGKVLLSFSQTSDTVSAVIGDGDTTETVTGGWLVGCDGGHSLVRKHAGIAFTGDTLEDVRMIVADLEVEGLDREAWHMWRHNDGFASLCPLPSTALFQYQASIAPGQNAELSLENMQATLDRRSGLNDVHLRAPVWSSLWRANVRLADHYRHGRVFLAGDAAHIHSPAGGQGMNTGIQDAQNLGWKLAAVVKGASPDLLNTYEAERRPIAIGVLALSNARLAQAMKEKGIPTQRDAISTQLGLSYRDSSLARDDRSETFRVRAGDRAPDAPELKTISGVHRLFELMRGPQFTLLHFGPAHAGHSSVAGLRSLFVVEETAGDDHVADSGGFLAAAYEATERTLVLIRPDGYIGMISDEGDTAAVRNYLASF